MSPEGNTCVRLNAKVRPSGEKAGKASPKMAVGGEVNLLFSPLWMETRAMALLSLTARNLPSGDHEEPETVLSTSANFRSGPPRGEISRISLLLPEVRRKAIWR